MQRRVLAVVCLALTGAWSACSASTGGGSNGSGGGGATGGSGASSGSGAQAGATSGGSGGAAATGGTGAQAGTGASGGTGATGGNVGDADTPDVTFNYDAAGGSGGLTQDSACASTSVEATLERQPADIIWAIDSSGSMDFEIGQVQQNMNAFSQQIVGSGIDVHVVLISSNDICIPAPLGSGSCPNDTKLPGFLHVPVSVGSNDALNKLRDTYSQYQSVLRTNAHKAFAVVSDDNATDGPLSSASAFTNAINALDASMFRPGEWKFHAIYAYTGPAALGTPCFDLTFQKAAAEGTVYRDLVNQTNGVSGNLCLQDFAPVFNAMASAVVAGSKIACEIPMPESDAGIIDPGDVSIELISQPGGTPQKMPNVGGAGNCASGGWYYDDPQNPTQLILCANTCSAVQSLSSPKINVLLGCLGA